MNLQLANSDFDQESVDIASALKAAGDPMRLDILKIMRRDSFGVLELCQIFGIQQPSMSHHLKVMVKAGLLGSRREGNSIFYRRVQNALVLEQQLLNQIYAIADIHQLSEQVVEAVSQVQNARKLKSKEFFQENVHRFREQQDLIAGFSDYGEAVQDLIADHKDSVWIEVGAGAGELLQAANNKFAKTIALDISEEMLEQSRSLVGGDNIEFILADTASAVDMNLKADCISCNMVLHHVPSPASVMRDMAEVLKPGGQLLICDLDKHDQEWAQTSCGDLWLGFAAEEISQWALDVGLKEGRAQFLALRNGFRVQIREFIK